MQLCMPAAGNTCCAEQQQLATHGLDVQVQQPSTVGVLQVPHQLPSRLRCIPHRRVALHLLQLLHVLPCSAPCCKLRQHYHNIAAVLLLNWVAGSLLQLDAADCIQSRHNTRPLVRIVSIRKHTQEPQAIRLQLGKVVL